MKKNIFEKIKKWWVSLPSKWKALPDKKRYIELITAALSIPMMLTVILVNMNNIKAQKEDKTIQNPTTTPIQVVIDNPSNNTATNSSIVPTNIPTITPTKTECKKDIGDVEIISPVEDEIITSDNLCINIATDNKYCGVTWSYRLNGGEWSEFNNKDICLYNLTAGRKQLQIKIKSTVIDKTITLERNFIYKNSITPTVTPTSTPTPTLTPTP